MITRLVNGFRVFQASYVKGNRAEQFEKLVTEGQSPKTLIIACSDSRLDPALLMESEPGDIFSVRNIAAMVPPYTADGQHHAASAAIQYAVTALKVTNIIILGHSSCGGIRALAESDHTLDDKTDFVSRWISISQKARDAVNQLFPNADIKTKSSHLERASLLVSMKNLMTFPYVAEAVEKNELKIYGWYFDMNQGELLNYDSEAMSFKSVLTQDVNPAIQCGTCQCAHDKLALDKYLSSNNDDDAVIAA